MKDKYLFDASSIIALVIGRKIDPLLGNCTIELAGYEIGNYLWKEVNLTKLLRHDDLPTLEKIFLKLLEAMNIINAWPPSTDIIKLAEELNLTYYDAAYLHQAKKLNLTLVTEDAKLKEKAEKLIEVTTAKGISLE